MKWKLITSGLLLLFNTMCFALSGYQIELLVFTHINATTLAAEQWPGINKQLFDFNHALDLNKVNSPELHSVSPAQFFLNNEQARLKKYSPYQILLHVAWRESLLQLGKPTTLRLYGGKLYNNNGQVIQSNTAGTSSMQTWQLDGTVTVTLDRYFNLKFNLLLAIPNAILTQLHTNSSAIQANQPFTYIPLTQSRRSKSGELNYLDHPLYGVLFKIIPI